VTDKPLAPPNERLPMYDPQAQQGPLHWHLMVDDGPNLQRCMDCGVVRPRDFTTPVVLRTIAVMLGFVGVCGVAARVLL